MSLHSDSSTAWSASANPHETLCPPSLLPPAPGPGYVDPPSQTCVTEQQPSTQICNTSLTGLEAWQAGRQRLSYELPRSQSETDTSSGADPNPPPSLIKYIHAPSNSSGPACTDSVSGSGGQTHDVPMTDAPSVISNPSATLHRSVDENNSRTDSGLLEAHVPWLDPSDRATGHIDGSPGSVESPKTLSDDAMPNAPTSPDEVISAKDLGKFMEGHWKRVMDNISFGEFCKLRRIQAKANPYADMGRFREYPEK